MSLGDKLQADRVARDIARGALGSRVEQVREDLEVRSLGGRIADKVTSDATEAVAEVADVARSNKPVVVGTLLALIAWVFRHRIATLLRIVTGAPEPKDDEEKEPDW